MALTYFTLKPISLINDESCSLPYPNDSLPVFLVIVITVSIMSLHVPNLTFLYLLSAQKAKVSWTFLVSNRNRRTFSSQRRGSPYQHKKDLQNLLDNV